MNKKATSANTLASYQRDLRQYIDFLQAKNIFGWVERETGKRKYDTALIENPRGHAKTTMAAGIGLYFMTGDALYPPGRPEEAV